MELSVKLIGHLLEYLPRQGEDFDGSRYVIDDGATLRALARDVGLPDDAEFFVMVNGDHVVEDVWETQSLSANDAVIFCPPLKGG